MMKKKRIILIIVSIIVIFAVIFIFMNRKKNLTMTINLELDGNKIELDDSAISCSYEGIEDCEYIFNENILKMENIKYGGYNIDIVIPKEAMNGYDEDLVLKLTYVQPEQNKSVDLNMSIKLVSDHKTLTGKYVIDYNDEEKHYEDDIESNNSELEIYWGL